MIQALARKAGMVVAGMLLCAAGTAMAQGSSAKVPRTGEFRFVGMVFKVPLPDGQCVAEGPAADIAQLLAAADDRNVTHITILPCGAQAFDKDKPYYLIKTPREALTAVMSRPELIKALADAFAMPEVKTEMDKAAGAASTAVSKTLNQKVDIRGKVQPLGTDKDCAYLGGVMELESAAVGKIVAAVGACMTSVEGKVFSVYRYGVGDTMEDVQVQMKLARDMAMGMTGAVAP